MLRKLLDNATWRGLLTGLLCALLVWLMLSLFLPAGVDDWLFDECFLWRGQRATGARIVLVGLDEKSLQELHKPVSFLSPELAQVVRHVHKQGPSAIGIDLFVPEDMSSFRDIAEPGSIGDARPMGLAVREAGNVVLARWRLADGWQRPLLQWRALALSRDEPVSTDLAFVNMTEDVDQYVRRQQLLAREDDEELVHFSLAVYAVSQKAQIEWDGKGQPVVGGAVVPLDGDGSLRINYVGPPGTFPVLPFRDVLDAARKDQPLPQLTGAVVLLGVTAPSFQDYHATPYANQRTRWLLGKSHGRMCGTEVLANVVATLHDRQFIRTPWFLSPWLALLVGGLLLGFLFARLSLAWGLVLTVAHHLGWQGLAVLAFAGFHWRLPMAGMLLLGALLCGMTFALRWLLVRDMLGRFKSHAIARAMEADPTRMTPGGEERELTILFADIRSFSTFSESHTPREVVALLNNYFERVVPVIEKHGGTLNQYMGDGMMVLFGAPTAYKDHAERAVRAAVEMVRLVHANAALWEELGRPGLRIGVGINTGKVVVGVVGSKNRLDYTAIGDATNTAARIEALNKEFHSEILISEATRAAMGEEKAGRLGCQAEGREVFVKGKQVKLTVYAVEAGEGAGASGPPAAFRSEQTAKEMP
jgi:adenylate cyclase